MAKIAKTQDGKVGSFTIVIDEPMIGMLHDCMKFVQGDGKDAFFEFISSINEMPVSQKVIDMYVEEFHLLIHQGFLKKLGVIPNE